MTTYTIAGGCFWCLDAVYRRLKGVSEVVSGYIGGDTIDPTYEEVSGGASGHAEAVEITFDEAVISSDVILDIFFLIHDPTTLNRQGHDVGTQYRSAMYYTNDTQKDTFEDALKRAEKYWEAPFTTDLSQLDIFYPAEEYHQDYFNKNPGNGYCSVVITPKIIKARSAYASWFMDA